MTRVIIIHGFGGIPNGGWFPWIMQELAKKKIPAFSFLLPNAKNPVVSEWTQTMNIIIGDEVEDTILVGHSLGVPAILRYLEMFPQKQKFKGIVFVAGVIEKLDVDDNESDFRKIDSFVDPKIDLARLRERANTFIVIHGRQDTIVPLIQGEKLARELGVDLKVVEEGDHFSQLSQPICYELPEALEAVLKIATD